MTDHEAFVREILEHPDDDAPRLIYADWLEERGDPRGEFIRVQCALARLPTGDPHREPLALRERRLLLAHADEWRAELPVLGGIVWGALARGFMDSIHVQHLKELEKQAAKVFSVAPVQAVYLTRLNDTEVRRLMRWGPIQRLRGLHLGVTGLRDQAIEKLAASPALANFTWLALPINALGSAALRALAGSAHAHRLTSLDLAYNQIGNTGVEALARSRNLPNLKELILHHNDVHSIGVHALVDSPYAQQLELLDLRHNDIVEPGRRLLMERLGERVRL
jgi:uncharacterized protein (TIGR02996 family)